MDYLKKIIKNDGFILLIILVLVNILYKRLLRGFFEQDEWLSFGWYVLHKNLNFVESLKFFFAPSLGHYNPLTNAVQNFLFYVWGMNYTKFALLGIGLHLLVVVSIYFLSKIIFKGNKLLAFLTTLLFGIFASGYQGVGWVVADISILSASIIGLVSAILFFKFLENEKSKYLAWSLVFLIFSLFFKEITIGLFPLFFFALLLKGNWKKHARYVFWVLGFGIAYVAFRVAAIFMPKGPMDISALQSQSWRDVLYNLVTIPLKTISQSLLPTDFVKTIAFNISEIFAAYLYLIPGSPEFEMFAVKVVMEALNLFIGLVVIIFSILGTIRMRKKWGVNFDNPIVLGLAWMILNSFIFAYAPETTGTVSVIDSRNLYFTAFGFVLFIVAVVKIISKNKTWLTVILLLPFLLFNIYWLRTNLRVFSKAGVIRKAILNQITSRYPAIPQKVIFYTQSDSSYYGLPDGVHILPFQSGFGQTLLVWYYQKSPLPSGFFENRFLWDIESQGYKEIDGRGFGYFRNLDLLVATIKKYNLPMNVVIAFRWDSKANSLTDITLEVQREVSVKK